MAKATVFYDTTSDPSNPGWSVMVQDEERSVTALDAEDADGAAKEAAASLGLQLAEVEIDDQGWAEVMSRFPNARFEKLPPRPAG